MSSSLPIHRGPAHRSSHGRAADRRPSRRKAVAVLVALATLAVTILSGSVSPARADADPAAAYRRPIVGTTVAVSPAGKVWDLAFLPDGTMIYTEKFGDIVARVGGTNRVLGHPSDVIVAREGGLMGLAVDPDFSTNRRIYTCLLTRAGGRPDDVRVVRWRVSNDLRSLSERTDIVTGIGVGTGAGFGRHAGCRPRFGPDGYLWVGTGDAGVASFPQDPDQLAGKVLRVDTDGQGAPGNPGGELRAEIYTYGHRNVQGIAFRPSDGKPYAVEHGTDRDDELNALVPGGNYGWDPVDPQNPSRYDETQPMTDLVKFPSAQRPVWTSGAPTIAPSAATFVTGSQWLGWDGSLVIGVLKDKHIMALTLSDDGMSVTERTDRVFDRGRIRTVVQGPDGNLYANEDALPSVILRVTPEPNCTAGFAAGPFWDVSPLDRFCPEITWAKDQSLVQGFSDGRFGTIQPLSRQAVARVLRAFAEGTGGGGVSPYTDVPPSHPFHNDIVWLTTSGIATGFADYTYRPNAPVTRQALASFLYKLAGSPPVDPNATTFVDVPPRHQFHDAIEWAASQGISVGFADSGFHPSAIATRQATVAMLHRAEHLRP